MLLLSVDGLEVLIYGFLFFAIVPPSVAIIWGLAIRKSKPVASKNLLIGAFLYWLVGAGLCGVMTA